MKQATIKTHLLLEELNKYLSTYCNVPSDSIVFSAIDLGYDNYWRWLCPPKYDGCSNIMELLKNSSFLAADNGISYYYCNDKQEARIKNKYFPDQRDIVYDCVGSYILWEVDNNAAPSNNNIKQNLPRKIMICISTYGSKLIETEDTEKVKECYSDIINSLERCDLFDIYNDYLTVPMSTWQNQHCNAVFADIL